MNNEVMKTETTAVATSAPPTFTGVLPSDVIIPSMLLMQGTSNFVKERKAQLGDIVRSTDYHKFGDPDKPFQIIALTPPQATWIKESRPKGAQRWEFKGTEERNASNDGDQWYFAADKDGNVKPDGTDTGYEWRRVKCLTLYAIIPSDVDAELEEMKKAADGEMPDLSKALTPIQIRFRSTSYNAGKAVVTHFTKAQAFKQEGYKYALTLGCYLENNEQGSFYVYKVDGKAMPVKKEHMEKVTYWANVVSQSANKLRVHEVEDVTLEDAPF